MKKTNYMKTYEGFISDFFHKKDDYDVFIDMVKNSEQIKNVKLTIMGDLEFDFKGNEYLFDLIDLSLVYYENNEETEIKNKKLGKKLSKILKEIYSKNKNLKQYENIQLADKYYFKPGILDENDRNLILKITNKDNLTYPITSLYKYLKDSNYDEEYIIDYMIFYHEELKKYNKNIFPIKNFQKDKFREEDFFALRQRKSLRDYYLKQIPKKAKRNLKDEIRKPRTIDELKAYTNKFEYFLNLYNFLKELGWEKKKIIEEKMFRSGWGLDQWIDFLEERKNLITTSMSYDDFEKIIEQNPYIEEIYKKDEFLLVEISDPEGIKELGCNSFWCFSYGDDRDIHRHWGTYSYNDIIYVIIDFNSPVESTEFMHVIIRPLVWERNNELNDESIFDMNNDPILQPVEFIENTIGLEAGKRLLTFDY